MPDSFLPTASLETLRLRARLLEQTRQFFAERACLEVQTPILSADTCVDAHIEPISLTVDGKRRFLQTSPEFAMKRLLAAGCGSIFQITHAFRSAESGSRHNREFTILEWYRIDAGYRELMDEVEDLVIELAGVAVPRRITYRDAFLAATGLDPFDASEDQLWDLGRQRLLAARPAERDDLLTFLWSEMVEPALDADSPVFIHDYPSTQSALALVRREGAHFVAERFELYVDGLELCNGWSELTDAEELRERFLRQNRLRVAVGRNPLPVDSRLMDAMRHGMPRCAGVAVGFDRLVMLAAGTREIRDVLAFVDENS